MIDWNDPIYAALKEKHEEEIQQTFLEMKAENIDILPDEELLQVIRNILDDILESNVNCILNVSIV